MAVLDALSLVWSNRKAIMWVLSIIGVGTAIAGAKIYYDHSQKKIHELEAQTGQYEQQIQIQNLTIATIRQDIEKSELIKKAYEAKILDLNKHSRDLEDVLFRERKNKTSLEELAMKDKKDRIEKHINKAVKKNLRCLEIISGSAIRPNENSRDCVSLDNTIDE